MPQTAAMPFFHREGPHLHATDAARGPWSADALHGRVIIGLLGAEIECLHGGSGFHPVRLTVDMYRAPPMTALEVVTRTLRDGKRIKVVEADLMAEGRSCGHAVCQFLLRGEHPEGEVWTDGGAWDAPLPAALQTEPASPLTMNGMWDIRFARGSLQTPGPRRLWMRENRELVGGEVLTPFGRVVAGVDYVSPMMLMGTHGLKYINTDVTLYLHRLPRGEWIGYSGRAQEASDGIAIGECTIHDEEGRIGWATVCGLAQPHIQPLGTPPR